jgi:hypothetical protein
MLKRTRLQEIMLYDIQVNGKVWEVSGMFGFMWKIANIKQPTCSNSMNTEFLGSFSLVTKGI